VEPEKVVVFPAAVDGEEVSRFRAGNRLRRKDKFIVISRLVSHKRVELAIEAIAKTRAKLVVVGTGPERERLERLAREKARGKVSFVHGLSTRRLYREICESKALIMPSEREGLSLVALEALALGTPVVVTDTSSLPKEVRRYCIEVREGRLGEALNEISRNYMAHEKRNEAAGREVLEEFSGDRAQAVYSGIMRRLKWHS
jgi:glycosyltransferase involved in cell wall biosynthesis